MALQQAVSRVTSPALCSLCSRNFRNTSRRFAEVRGCSDNTSAFALPFMQTSNKNAKCCWSGFTEWRVILRDEMTNPKMPSRAAARRQTQLRVPALTLRSGSRAAPVLPLCGRAVAVHSTENCPPRYKSWLMILICKSLFFPTGVLARCLLPWGPLCWERAGKSPFLPLCSWRVASFSKGISIFQHVSSDKHYHETCELGKLLALC